MRKDGGMDRMQLRDKYYHRLWDSTTATTPAYRHINTWVNTTIDKPDGTRWWGQLYRCPEGIRRWSSDDLTIIYHTPNPCL